MEEPEVGVRPMSEQLVVGEVGAYETAGKGREERADRFENGLQFDSLATGSDRRIGGLGHAGAPKGSRAIAASQESALDPGWLRLE